jgi:polyferredoxin
MWGGNVIQDIWYIMKAHPEYVAFFLLLFIGLVVLFRFILEVRVTPYVLVLLATNAFVLYGMAILLLYGMDKRKNKNSR